jgi:parallel beta-helix repeat protein
MKKRYFRCSYGIIMLVAFSLAGCVVATKSTAISPAIREMFEGTYTIDPYMEAHRPVSIALLPFTDESRSQKGTETVRKYFYNHFSSLPFKDMELHRVDYLLRKAGLTDPDVIRKTKPQELGKILNVDAVVYGSISNFDKIFAVVYSQVAVGATIEMYDTKTGHFLWSGAHTSRIQEGGISTTPIGIIATVIATSMNVQDIQLLRACDDLFRDMVKTIPVPTIAETAQPPVIEIMTQDTKGVPKKAGDEIRVVMRGTKHMRAYFDIGTYKKGIDMKEIEDGGYLGVYRVVPGDNVSDAVITAYLVNDSGATAQWVDAVGTVTLDTTPPETPADLKTVGRDTFVLLDWDKNTEPDLAGYRIYRSMTPLSGFQQVAQIEFNHYSNEGLQNSVTYFYKVSAFDMAGNESTMTGAVAGMPVAPGPTPVSGEIDGDTVWYAGASPYIIEDTVMVKDKARLTIEPGTTVKSKGPALVVKGRFDAVGDEQHLIRFEGVDEAPWEGVVFENVRENENNLRFCVIKGATYGIACKSSSPLIESCEFTQNGTAIQTSGSFSRPVIKDNTIRANTVAGIAVIDGSQPKITGNTIHGNDKIGIAVTMAAPNIKENTIIQNNGSGVSLRDSQGTVTANNIYDNSPFNMTGPMDGEAANARDNWWGTSEVLDILSGLKGKIDISSVLDGPYPAGKPRKLALLESELGGEITADSYLMMSRSPYKVAKTVTIDKGATVYIEPGVTILFDQNTGLVAKDGGIVAKGNADAPIRFTASGASPSPGFYSNVVRFEGEETTVNSFFEFCVITYATTAFDIHWGTPQISYCHIARNAQSGVYCRNDAAPKILYTTFSDNQGEGAIRCVGMSKPVINYNNFVDNSVAVQSFSSIYIDARHNWWGADPPDKNQIWGTNVNIEPWLTEPEKKAFTLKEQ